MGEYDIWGKFRCHVLGFCAPILEFTVGELAIHCSKDIIASVSQIIILQL